RVRSQLLIRDLPIAVGVRGAFPPVEQVVEKDAMPQLRQLEALLPGPAGEERDDPLRHWLGLWTCDAVELHGVAAAGYLALRIVLAGIDDEQLAAGGGRLQLRKDILERDQRVLAVQFRVRWAEVTSLFGLELHAMPCKRHDDGILRF